MVVKTWTQEEVNAMSDNQLKKAWLQQEQEIEKGDNYDDENDEINLDRLAKKSKEIDARLAELEKIIR